MKGKSVAEKIASMRPIPENMLPSTLKHNIVVPKLAELKLEYSTTAKEFGPMYSFYRKYIADLRYHNPSLKLVREVTEDGPLVARIVLKSQSGQENPEDMMIESSKVKTEE